MCRFRPIRKRVIFGLYVRKSHVTGKRRTLPPLNAIRAFEAAARHGSIKEAASELGVTHGAVSRQVALLEDWLGPPALFQRLNRRVVLTPAGAALLSESGLALDQIAVAARRHIDRRGEAPSTVLRVNATATFSLRWLLPRLAAFRTEHGAIDVHLTTGNEPVDAVRDSFDVIIRGGPATYAGFTSRVFLSERRLPVCSPTLLARAPLHQATDLGQHTLLHVATMPRLWRDWFRLAGLDDVDPGPSLILDHFYLAVQAALDGLGVAMGPTALVADDLTSGRLVAPFPHLSLPARDYYAYLPEADSADPAVALFCDWLQQAGRPDG
jgi:LysR family glycine cleavage system transcriptional activator